MSQRETSALFSLYKILSGFWPKPTAESAFVLSRPCWIPWLYLYRPSTAGGEISLPTATGYLTPAGWQYYETSFESPQSKPVTE
jgi:hypothetical protein